MAEYTPTGLTVSRGVASSPQTRDSTVIGEKAILTKKRSGKKGFANKHNLFGIIKADLLRQFDLYGNLSRTVKVHSAHNINHPLNNTVQTRDNIQNDNCSDEPVNP